MIESGQTTSEKNDMSHPIRVAIVLVALLGGPNDLKAQQNPDQPTTPSFDKVPEVYLPSDMDDDETRLQKELIRVLYELCGFHAKRVQDGMIDPRFHQEALVELCQARIDFHKDLKDKIQAAEDLVAVSKELERQARIRDRAGIVEATELPRWVAYRIKAELRLVRLKNQRGTQADD